MRGTLSVVVLTHNRAAELRRTLERMLALSHPPPIVVVDNGSRDGTGAMIKRCFPTVGLLSLASNEGAAARNAGVGLVGTDYVAFCDDDTWWEEGALERAAAVLDAHENVAVVCARVLVGPGRTEDPTCAHMAASPLPREGLPGPSLLGFLAGASVMRRRAFLQAGGYEPRLFIGGEEALLSLDLLAAGWRIVYAADATVCHFPSHARDGPGRRRLLVRNALWLAWMRLPLALSLCESVRLLGPAVRDMSILTAGLAALGGLPWALKRRRAVPAQLARWYRLLH